MVGAAVGWCAARSKANHRTARRRGTRRHALIKKRTIEMTTALRSVNDFNAVAVFAERGRVEKTLQTVSVSHVNVDACSDEDHEKHDDIHETVAFFAGIFEMRHDARIFTMKLIGLRFFFVAQSNYNCGRKPKAMISLNLKGINLIGNRLQKVAKRLYNGSFRRHPRKTWVLVVCVLMYAICLPSQLFRDPVSVVLEDKSGTLLGARIATDGQWRFPASDSIPERYVACVVEFEDRRFWYHPGIDPVGIVRALKQNSRANGVVSGGSTLTMQVIRMSRRAKSRSLWQKIVEMIWATRLELRCSKSEILSLYADNAPFGGNVVGLEAASWRYFGKKPSLLSWAESAVLAVLPNSPALLHPGRNRSALLAKRNRLLDRLEVAHVIDAVTCQLAKEEPLPDAPLPLPRLAPHLLDRATAEFANKKSAQGSRFRSTIDANLQSQANQVLQRHHSHLLGNDIHNLAAIVIEVETGAVLAYVGNVPGAGVDFGEQVDVIRAERSTGSVLKPFLYAAMLNDGALLPNALVLDIPTEMNGYRPENFQETYDGVISARRALSRSLNIPFVRLLGNYGTEKFHRQLQRIGISTLSKPASYYGLTLILGGAEGTLWDISGAYASMSRTARHYYPYEGKYDQRDWREPHYLLSQQTKPTAAARRDKTPPIFGAAACWATFDAMQEVERPDGEGNWEYFQSSRRVAWKTGTSLGFRDAWAVGTTPKYVIGVWVGNANGEGRPGLIGVEVAAPVLFDLFNLLPPDGQWFDPPYDQMQHIATCRESGYRATELCPTDSVWAPTAGLRFGTCPYHQLVHLDQTGKFQVAADCEQPTLMQHVPWFVLPPVEAYYYRVKHPSYKTLPPFRADCLSAATGRSAPMQMIYPNAFTRIYVPVNLDGTRSHVVFEVAHTTPETVVYWHLDNNYVGTTRQFHELSLQPTAGRHTLTVVDADGYRISQDFEIVDKAK